MWPKMRSIFAQVHRKSLSMGSRRDFSSSSAASSEESNRARAHARLEEIHNLYSIGYSFWIGFGISASVVAYKIYKNYYPKLLICREEHKRMLKRHNELWGQREKDLDI